MLSIKFSTVFAFAIMVAFTAVEQARGEEDLECNFDQEEFAKSRKIFNECYMNITGRPAPEDPSEIYADSDKTELRNVFICSAQAVGTIEADGKTINFDKIKEQIQHSKQPDNVKTAMIEGNEECCDAYSEHKDLDEFFKCVQMVFMNTCL